MTEKCIVDNTAKNVTGKRGFLYDRVVILGCDGAGTFFKQAETPNIDRIFANSAVTYDCLSMKPTISAQCWGSMIHGVLPEVHMLNNSNTARTPYSINSDYPSFFRIVRENDPYCKLASFCKWDNINVGIVEDDLGIDKYIAADDIIAQQACDYIQDNDPKVMLVVFNDPDTGGHTYGYGSQGQLDMIKVTDERIGMIYDAYEAKGWLDTTLFIVTADHGGAIGTHGHGGWSDAEKYVMLAALGKTVPEGTIGEMDLRDVASIVTYALGYDQPDIWTSRVPSGLFEGVEAGERPVFILPGNEFREHESVPTPEKGSVGYISNFITDKKLTHYLTFDGDLSDEFGSNAKQNNKLYFVDGYFGKGVSLDDGYISIPNYAPGNDSFTVSAWVKTSGISSDPPLFSNKNWHDGYSWGYVLCMRDTDLKFNVGGDGQRADITIPYPLDYASGWMHVMLIVDRRAAKVSIVLDFKDTVTLNLPDNVKDYSFTSEDFNTLNIGQDGSSEYSASLSATVDEFMIFDGAFTEDEIAALGRYYGKN